MSKEDYERGFAEGVKTVMKELEREQKVSYANGYVGGLRYCKKVILNTTEEALSIIGVEERKVVNE